MVILFDLIGLEGSKVPPLIITGSQPLISNIANRGRHNAEWTASSDVVPARRQWSIQSNAMAFQILASRSPHKIHWLLHYDAMSLYIYI